jgi:hypothetical protein
MANFDRDRASYERGKDGITNAPWGLEADGIRAHNSEMMDKLFYDRTDYSVVVKNKGSDPQGWKWEIYRAGNANPIKRSATNFNSVTKAKQAGNEALKQLLDRLFS